MLLSTYANVELRACTKVASLIWDAKQAAVTGALPARTYLPFLLGIDSLLADAAWPTLNGKTAACSPCAARAETASHQ